MITSIKENLFYQTITYKLFWRVEKAFSGISLYYALTNIDKKKDIDRICQEFVNDQIIIPVYSREKSFKKSPDCYYQFAFDVFNLRNYKIIWNKPPNNAEKVMEDILKKTRVLLQKVNRELNKSGFITEESIQDEMDSFCYAICEL